MIASIIIVNYNTKDLLRSCLESITENTAFISYEVIVVDNASVDGSAKMIMDEFSWVRLVLPEKNLGFGKANNLGAKHAQGQYLFFLNPDTVLLSNAVEVLITALMSNKDVMICGGSLYGKHGEPVVAYGNFPSLFQEFSDIGFRYLYSEFYKKR